MTAVKHPRVLVELFGRIEPELCRFPAIDPPTLRAKVDRVLAAPG